MLLDPLFDTSFPDGVCPYRYPLSLASDFSGMEAAGFALSAFPFFQHRWACDWGEQPRLFIAANFPNAPCHRDITTRTPAAGPVTFYVAGPPCQPFASNGRRKGESDPRSSLFGTTIDSIIEFLPITFAVENSNLVATVRKGQFLRETCDRLTDAGYCVSHKILNTHNLGLPNNRKRIWIVGTRSDCVVAPLSWHTHIKPIALSDLLIPLEHDISKPHYRPLAPTAAKPSTWPLLMLIAQAFSTTG